MRNETIIIPSLEPGQKLIKLIQGLKEFGFYRITIVDDGSSSDYKKIFETAGLEGARVLTHIKNLGKGEAIKTAIKDHLDTYGSGYGVITVDADGQHLPSDVAKISNAMNENPDALILGTRDFSSKNVPKRSLMGNRITSLFFKISTGITCDDTQTGLRGIPSQLLNMALETEGTRYEYEMNFLREAVKTEKLVNIPIQTIYEDGNSGSHFRTVRDSLRVYGRPLRFLVASLTSAVIDFLFFYILTNTLGFTYAGIILTATVIARIISGSVNFTLNKFWCFRSKDRTSKEALKYFILFIVQMCMSAVLVYLVSLMITPIIAKIIVDTTLFIVSYILQRDIVFNNKPTVRRINIMKRKKPVWAVSFGILLTGYTAFTLLDAFVIPHDTVKLSEVETEDTSTFGNSDSGDSLSGSSDSGDSVSNSSDNSDTGGFIIADENGNEDENNSANRSKRNRNNNDDISSSGNRPDRGPGRGAGKIPKDGGHRHGRPGDISNVEAAENKEKQSESSTSDKNSSNSNSSEKNNSELNSSDNSSSDNSSSDNSSSDNNSSDQNSSESLSNDMTYESDNVSISITKKYVDNTYVYIADVQLKDGGSLKSAVADNTLGRNITAKTSEIASDANAILAINGDYYGFRDTGYVMRNGYLYRDTVSESDAEDLVVYSDGTMEIIKEGDISASELKDKGAVQIYSFGPGLIEDGKISVSENEDVEKSMNSNPRTAIGYYSPTHYCFVVSDGRTSESKGLSLYQLAEIMDELGVEQAYNLDGGGSTTMYFNGEVINNPTTNGNKISERNVSDIIYIGK